MDTDKNQVEDTYKPAYGFTVFLNEVASLLTLAVVKKLAQELDYSSKEIAEYDNVNDPGSKFTKSLKEKHIVSRYDISRLVDALKSIDLRGVSDDVERLGSKLMKKEGFAPFLDEVASLLTLPVVKKLAQELDYSSKEIAEYDNVKDPGSLFTKSLREKHIVSREDISRLVDALKSIDLRGVSNDVERLFDQRRKLTKIEARKKTFINEIKKAYRDLYESIRPIPFSKDKLMPVNDLFLDSGIQIFDRSGPTVKGNWKDVGSYHEIFTECSEHSKRCLLLGEPGFGKGTLALKFAYDWGTNSKDSPLRNFEILIFLRLRRISPSISIFGAIKQFLMSDESTLSVKEVEEILENSKSVVMVLEGFEKDGNKTKRHEEDHVTKIIRGRMFPNFLVILTTTPSCKPENMPPTTMQVRLTGFDKDAQDRYLSKAFGSEKCEEIKTKMINNPIIRELCKIPFVFGIVLNFIGDDNVPFKFNKVTGLFRYTIGSFYEQMKTKLREDDPAKYDKLGENHRKLDKLSFEALTEKNQDKKWMKDNLRKLIGMDLYDRYIAVGILVEDNVIVIDESVGAPTSTLVQRKIQTRFYHKLFREWFAAHYISLNATKMFTVGFESSLEKLYEKYKKKSVQYVFQFACGINPNASTKIIKFLQNKKKEEVETEEVEDLVHLCILEQKDNDPKRSMSFMSLP